MTGKCLGIGSVAQSLSCNHSTMMAVRSWQSFMFTLETAMKMLGKYLPRSNSGEREGKWYSAYFNAPCCVNEVGMVVLSLIMLFLCAFSYRKYDLGLFFSLKYTVRKLDLKKPSFIVGKSNEQNGTILKHTGNSHLISHVNMLICLF